MVEDHGNDVQREDLIGDDVASDLASAINDGQPVDNGHDDHHGDDQGVVQTPDEDQNSHQPLERPPIKPTDNDSQPDMEALHSIKHQALQELGPLVEHIEQEPEERFDTLMMMIRASDDASLVKSAYEAAQQIEDDNKKAQALLDVVNEVNYLTRPPENEAA